MTHTTRRQPCSISGHNLQFEALCMFQTFAIKLSHQWKNLIHVTTYNKFLLAQSFDKVFWSTSLAKRRTMPLSFVSSGRDFHSERWIWTLWRASTRFTSSTVSFRRDGLLRSRAAKCSLALRKKPTGHSHSYNRPRPLLQHATPTPTTGHAHYCNMPHPLLQNHHWFK